jgi:hypothetical protein
MFFTFKKDGSKKDDRIATLEKGMNDRFDKLEEEIFYLKNPPKFNVGDLVHLHYGRDISLLSEVTKKYAYKEDNTTLDEFIIVSISRSKYKEYPYGSNSYDYTYQIIDKDFKKLSSRYEGRSNILKLITNKESKKK